MASMAAMALIAESAVLLFVLALVPVTLSATLSYAVFTSMLSKLAKEGQTGATIGIGASLLVSTLARLFALTFHSFPNVTLPPYSHIQNMQCERALELLLPPLGTGYMRRWGILLLASLGQALALLG